MVWTAHYLLTAACLAEKLSLAAYLLMTGCTMKFRLDCNEQSLSKRLFGQIRLFYLLFVRKSRETSHCRTALQSTAHPRSNPRGAGVPVRALYVVEAVWGGGGGHL